MECADSGDLSAKIERYKNKGTSIPEKTIWSILRQMALGLNALHKQKIVHRDIKCANVFMKKDGTVKLGDLNVSKIDKIGEMKT